MNRYLLLLIGLLIRVSVMQAQQATTVNTVYQPTMVADIPTATRHTKATEAPFYIKVYGFYSLLTPGAQINYSGSQSQISIPTTYKAAKTHLGAGPRAGIGIGLIVSDFINVGIDADVLFGTSLTVKNDVFVGSTNNYRNYNSSTTTTLKVLSITPNITFKALSRPAYYIYNRLGLVGGVVLDYKDESNTLETPVKSGSITQSVGTGAYTKNSLAIGYQAALGIQFRLSQALRGFAEVVAYNQSFKPREIQGTTISTQNGTTTTQRSTTVFKNEGDYNNSDPYEQPSFNVAINSVGVGAGLVLRF